MKKLVMKKATRIHLMSLIMILMMGILALSRESWAEEGVNVSSDEAGIALSAFREVYPFTEGLSLARREGLFGYIDSSGAWVIPPWFDYGEPFSDSTAIAYLNGKPFLLNRRGLLRFDHPYVRMKHLDGHRFLVESENGTMGVIDHNGDVLVSPIYEKVLLPDSRASVLTLVRRTQSGARSYSVVDSVGIPLVPEGKYAPVHLRPESQLRYTTPAFEGAIPTRVRAALTYQEVDDPDTTLRKLYSNDIPATINPGQFWRWSDREEDRHLW